MTNTSRVFLLRNKDGISVRYAVRYVQTTTPDNVLFYYDQHNGKYWRGQPPEYNDNYVLYECADDPTLVSGWDLQYIIDALNNSNIPLMPEVWYPQYAHMSDIEYADFARRYDTIPLADLIEDGKEAARLGKG